MSNTPPKIQLEEQPQIDFIDSRYVVKKRLSEEEIIPFHNEAVDLAQRICTLGFYKYRKPISPQGMSGLHYTNTHALSPRVPYRVATGEELEIGVRFSTHCTGDDPEDLADPYEKVVELGIFYDNKGKRKDRKLEDSLQVRADLRHHMVRIAQDGWLNQYPEVRSFGIYSQNDPKDLDSFMKGVRYVAGWLGQSN